jgi:hypothetical protein
MQQGSTIKNQSKLRVGFTKIIFIAIAKNIYREYWQPIGILAPLK